MSPFISVSRRRRRRRLPALAALFALLLLVTGAAPAFGGPSALSIAKKALKTANKAETDAKKSRVGSARLVNGAVVSDKIANGAVGTIKLTPASVTNDRIADGAVGAGKLADGAVTTAKLADGSIGTAKIANGSVTLKDLAGTDQTGTINMTAIPAHTCGFLDLDVTGAQVGQFPLIAFEGDVALPLALMVMAIKVNAANTIRGKVCNPTDSATSAVNGVGVRVITLN